MLPSSQTTSSAPRTGEAVWKEETRRELKRDVLPDRGVDALRLARATDRQRPGSRVRDRRTHDTVEGGELNRLKVSIEAHSEMAPSW